MHKRVIGGIVLVIVACGWGTMSVGEQTPAPQGELHVVDKSSVKPYVTMLNLAETSVTEQHWSVRRQQASTPE
jgi:hypothetical protein